MMNKKCQPRFPFFEELDKGLSMLVNEVLQQDSESSTDSPRLSIYELDEEYRVECDLPGVELSDIELKLENGVLEISGTRRQETPDGARVTHSERTFEAFHRRLQLGRDVDSDGVDAELGAGVLRVTIPKSAAVRSHQIPIRASRES